MLRRTACLLLVRSPHPVGIEVEKVGHNVSLHLRIGLLEVA